LEDTFSARVAYIFAFFTFRGKLCPIEACRCFAHLGFPSSDGIIDLPAKTFIPNGILLQLFDLIQIHVKSNNEEF
jgi:hypothetical protein